MHYINQCFTYLVTYLLDRVIANDEVKVKANITLPGNTISELWDATCHMGSHSVTCHPTQVNVPCQTPAMLGERGRLSIAYRTLIRVACFLCLFIMCFLLSWFYLLP